MAAITQFRAPSLDMAISVRVEVYDSRAAASAKKGTAVAKFRMRTHASTTFGALGELVAQRYMKESAGTIKTMPGIACIVDKDDCTFDLDDSIDQIAPNEPIRFVLDRSASPRDGYQLSESESASMPAQPASITQNTVPTTPAPQPHRPATKSEVSGAVTAQRQLRLSSSSRKPFLLTQRQGKPLEAAAVSQAPQAAGKRDPYDIDSDSDINDPPSQQRPTRRSMQRPSPGTTKIQGQSTRKEADDAKSRLPSTSDLPPSAGAISISNGPVSHPKIMPVPQEVAQPMSQQQEVGRAYVSRAEDLSVSNSVSEAEIVSEEEVALVAEPSLRSLGKRAHHTVNDHVEIVERTGNIVGPAVLTPIMLKNSKGFFPVYRKGETPFLASKGLHGSDLDIASASKSAHRMLSQSSPGIHTRPQTTGSNVITPVAPATATKPPNTLPIIDIETEFAGFDELSDFEIHPTARAAVSQPSHRTRTPSRSSLKQPITTTSADDFRSSNHLRSSPLESKQRRILQPRRAKQTQSPLCNKATPPARGSNNRASQERFAGTTETPARSTKKQEAKSVTKSSVKNKPPNPPSSAGSRISGDTIRQWVASRQRKSQKAPPPKNTISGIKKPVSVQEVIQQVKAITEVRIRPKPQPSNIPAPFSAKSDEDEESESGCSTDEYLPRSSQDARAPQRLSNSPQKPQSSRASSRRSSLSSHRSATKRGPIPSSPFCPMDSIAIAAQGAEEAVPVRRFGRGYSKRVRETFSDASDSSGGNSGGPSSVSKQFTDIPGHLLATEEQCRGAAPCMGQPANSQSPTLGQANGVSLDQPQPCKHPDWRPWWHPWGWINRYETNFLPGGIIGNGPFEGYVLFNETPGVYVDGCEAPSHELLAAEDLVCKKDEFRLMRRRERRRERRVRGDFLAHEDDGYDSPAELAREFEDDADLSGGFGYSMSLEIPNSAETSSDLDSQHEDSSDKSERQANTILSLPEDTHSTMPVDENENDDDHASDLPRGISPVCSDVADVDVDRAGIASHNYNNGRQAENVVPNDRVAEQIVRMERTRQYALTGEASSQSQSQNSSSSPIADTTQLNNLARASIATSANSTNTSVLIVRQLTCVSSPPSNQELALLMSSSPAKGERDTLIGRHQDEDCESSSESCSGIPARLLTGALAHQRRNSVEIAQTPERARISSDPKQHGSATNNTLLATVPEAVTEPQQGAHAKSAVAGVEKTSDGVSSDVVVEIPALSQEQRSQYSDVDLEKVGSDNVRPEKVTSSVQLRSFHDINGTQKDAHSPLLSIPQLTGEDEIEHEIQALSPTVAARARRRVTFGDNVDDMDVVDLTKSLRVPDSPTTSSNTTSAAKTKGALKKASPSKGKPARPKRVPVVSFAVSDSEERHSRASLNGMPNIIESGSLLVEEQSKIPSEDAETAQGITQLLPPPRWSFNDLSSWPERRPFSSQPLPVAHTRPRIVTPIPPPIIPSTSTSSLYNERPNIIEIKSSVSSDSNRESDIVIISAPIARTIAQTVSPPKATATEPIEINSSPSPSPSLTPSSPPNRPVAESYAETQGVRKVFEEPAGLLLDQDDGPGESIDEPPKQVQELMEVKTLPAEKDNEPEAQNEEGQIQDRHVEEQEDQHKGQDEAQNEQLLNQENEFLKHGERSPIPLTSASPGSEKHNPAASIKPERSTQIESSKQPPTAIGKKVKKSKRGKKLKLADVIANARAQNRLLESVSRYGGRRLSNDHANYRAVTRVFKKDMKRRRSLQNQEYGVPLVSAAPGTFSPGCGGKRRHSAISQHEHDEHDEHGGRRTPGADASDKRTGTMLADATARLRRGESPHGKMKKRKLSHGSQMGDTKYIPTSSASNVPSSHPSLISPPTTSRPSSAGSRDV